ncbi:MAG: 2-phosphosulfolactate phosphatase family protein [Leptolyngbyaceae bacterium]|nr:2-phosphosulfolactate phosphatase family protein [Leptolyngbyaceae bacterium]
MKLFVFHTPEEVPSLQSADCDPPDCSIAIDVLRATTTIATAIAHGAEAVQAFSDINELMQASAAFPEDKRIRAGERGGMPLEGCELGNSPLDCTVDVIQGKRLFITTTNGTRCLKTIQASATVLTAALVNRRSVVEYLLQTRPETVWLVGSGWEGSYALEDTVCAGAIASSLKAHLERQDNEHYDIVGNDEVVGALALYEQWGDRLLELMYLASHGRRLQRLERFDDLKFCAQLDTLDVLPIQEKPGVLVQYVG